MNWMTRVTGITHITKMTGMIMTLFLTKHSKIFQGLSRTNFSFFKDSNQKLELTFFSFFDNMTAILIFILKVFLCLLLLGT